MKSFLPKALFFYSALASLLITLSLVFTSQSLIPVVFATLFLPVTAYFTLEFFNHLREKTDLKLRAKKGELVIILIVFLVLTGVSLRNILSKNSTGVAPQNKPVESSEHLIFKVTSPPSSSPSAKLKEVTK